jgi:hypothetical protein
MDIFSDRTYSATLTCLATTYPLSTAGIVNVDTNLVHGPIGQFHRDSSEPGYVHEKYPPYMNGRA